MLCTSRLTELPMPDEREGYKALVRKVRHLEDEKKARNARPELEPEDEGPWKVSSLVWTSWAWPDTYPRVV